MSEGLSLDKHLVLDSAKSVSASFRAAPLVKIVTGEYVSAQSAYDNGTVNGSVLMLLGGIDAAVLTANHGIGVTVQAG